MQTHISIPNPDKLWSTSHQPPPASVHHAALPLDLHHTTTDTGTSHLSFTANTAVLENSLASLYFNFTPFWPLIFALLSFSFSAAICVVQFSRPPPHQPYLPSMEPESPDWDRSPSVVMETKDEIFEHLPTKSETSPTTEVKREDTTKEEDSPSNPPFLCPPVSSFPDPTTPPAKAPPVSHTSYRNLSTRAPPLPTLKDIPHARTLPPPSHTLQHHHRPIPLPPAVRIPSSSPPTFPSCPRHALDIRL